MLVVADSKARTSGIRQYLEKGTKNDRDLKDERVPLHGDLDVLDATIKAGNAEGWKETYRNIVLSFEEDHLENETLQEITDDFIRQYTAGYEEGEYVAYAEAHLPKIKETTDPNTGEIKTRKPHIHISIALYSPILEKQLALGNHGQRMSYDGSEFGLWKTYIEEKYGLRSVERQAIQTDISEIRTEQPKLKGRKELIQSYNQTIRQNVDQIQSVVNIIEKLKEAHPDILEITPSTQKAKEPYISIKTDAQTIRLKGQLFCDSTFSQAIQQLQDEKEEKVVTYKEAGQPREIERPSKLEEITAKRIANIAKRDASARQRAAVAVVEIEPEQKPDADISHPLGEGRDRQSVHSKVQKERQAPRHKIKTKEEKREALRERMKSKPCNPIQYRLQQIRQEEIMKIQQKEFDMKEIKRFLQADQLLAQLGQTHGLNPQKYKTFTTELGETLITAGSRNMKVSDFLTKEMNFTWQEVKPYLETAKMKNILFDLNKIKQDLEPRYLFKQLSIDENSYKTYKNEKGWRINVGTRMFNVTDFLTKHIGKTWPEAREILAAAYKELNFRA